MKKVLIYAALVVFCSLFVEGRRQMASGPAQGDGRKEPDAARNIDEHDKAIAADIKKLADRSQRGLVDRPDPDGGVTIDLERRFQNVMLARLDGEEATSACVTDIGEANRFFGKDLETGVRIPRTVYPKTSKAENAARHGMSEQEFDFYKKLIGDDMHASMLAPQAASITISNTNLPGEGFNDATAAFVVGEGGNAGTTRGQQRLNVFAHAAAIWGAFLDSSVTTVVDAKFEPLACSSGSAVLGSAGAAFVSRDFPNAPFTGTWYHRALANKIRGFDGAGAEINATFNSNFDGGCFAPGHRFYYGLDNSTPANRTNLLVVVLHEMGHGLGFSSFGDGSTGALLNGHPDVYMQFMHDRSTGLKWSSMTDAQRQASALNNGNVFWDGPNVRIASNMLVAGTEAGTGRVQLYTPSTFSGGSSISHFDMSASPNLLMEPNINSGLAIDGDLTKQQLRDIGWFRDTTADNVRDTITGVFPVGVVVVGNNVEIGWTNSGSFSRNVTIELSTDGGTNYTSTIASNIANTGSYTWTVPNLPTSQARVRVREAGFVEPAGSTGSNFTISLAPTAANVSVTGRVADTQGYGVNKARVTLTDAEGNAFYGLSNAFGYFRIDDVPAGRTYFATVRSKRFDFAPRTVSLNDSLLELDFIALP